VQCVEVTARDAVGEHTADAAVTRVPGAVLVVLTADCLPVFFSDQEGSVVAVAHAGWRGLCQGVLEATVKAMAVHPDEIIAHLGPAIGPAAFEVGPEVREVFVNADPAAESAFRPGVRDRFMADLPTLARQRLARLGVLRVSGGEHCTFSRPDLFYSHRRDPLSGRMASIIWRDTPL
jgi:YfiH family protein